MIHNKNFPFDGEDREIVHVTTSPLWKHHKWKILGLAFVIASVMFGGKYLYDLGRGSTNPLDAPLIIAKNEPYKTKPEDPGGMVIPHMDKDIFDSIDEDFEPEAENVKPIDTYEKPIGFENPKDPIKDLAADEKPTKTESKNDTYKKPEAEKPNPKTVKVDGSSTYKKPVIRTVNAKKIDVDKVLAKQKAPEIWVQLGTFNSEDLATKSWQQVSEQNNDILSGYNIRVTKSDLGDKGIFYRMQSGPFFSDSEAQDLCKKLNDREQSCFPIRPIN